MSYIYRICKKVKKKAKCVKKNSEDEEPVFAGIKIYLKS
jgi:hypothetical protein